QSSPNAPDPTPRSRRPPPGPGTGPSRPDRAVVALARRAAARLMTLSTAIAATPPSVNRHRLNVGCYHFPYTQAVDDAVDDPADRLRRTGTCGGQPRPTTVSRSPTAGWRLAVPKPYPPALCTMKWS